MARSTSRHFAHTSCRAATAASGTPEETTVVKDVAIAGTLDAPTGQWDIKAGKFIIDYTGGSTPLDKTFAWVKAGLNLAGGFWDGNGIMSSTAAADLDYLHAVGIMDNNYEGSPIYSEFGGQTIPTDAVLGAWIYFGDTLLRGTVGGNIRRAAGARAARPGCAEGRDPIRRMSRENPTGDAPSHRGPPRPPCGTPRLT